MRNIGSMGCGQPIDDSKHELQPLTFGQLIVRINEHSERQRVIVHHNDKTINIGPRIPVDISPVREWVIDESLDKSRTVADNMMCRLRDELYGECPLALISEGQKSLPRSRVVPVNVLVSTPEVRLHALLRNGHDGRRSEAPGG